MTETVISDDSIREYFNNKGEAIWKQLETTVFTDTENLIGRGQTARIKRFDLATDDLEVPSSLAIKYLVTPTEKTLSVSGEHDLIREVERIQRIEQDESAHTEPINYMRVPHPYFYHRHGKIQCYGMEEIDGINLLQATRGENGIEEYDSSYKEDFLRSLHGVNRENLMEEIDRFFDTMHKTCLHGDMKPANMMISREGKFYVIDFGQSVLATDVDEKSTPAFENLKDEEKMQAKMAVRNFLTTLGL
jgi:serine/threonine protein kinase